MTKLVVSRGAILLPLIVLVVLVGFKVDSSTVYDSIHFSGRILRTTCPTESTYPVQDEGLAGLCLHAYKASKRMIYKINPQTYVIVIIYT